MTKESQAALVACRWHPDAKQIGPVEIIDKRTGKRHTCTFCLACEMESKPSGPTEFAS